MKNINKSIIKWLLIIVPVLGLQYESTAQCNILVGSKICTGTPVNFSVQSPGATGHSWTIDGSQYTGGNPQHSFANPGSYTVTVNLTTATGQPCTSTITITVRAKPTAAWSIANDPVQCFKGNNMCVNDLSTAAPNVKLARSSFVIAGTGNSVTDPVNPRQICVSSADPQGGFYSVVLEVEDEFGCIDRTETLDVFEILPALFISFRLDTLQGRMFQGCDTVYGRYANTSLINRNAVSSFIWHFGDGNTNTTDWDTVRNRYIIQGPNNGAFTGRLVVTDTTRMACRDSFIVSPMAINILLPDTIVSVDSICASQNPVAFFYKAGNLPPGASFDRWNFGDPLSGQNNFDFQNPVSSYHSFSGLGPFLVSHTYNHNLCGLRKSFKQVSVIGPASSIPGPGIPINQRYKCDSIRPVQFPNGSTFFHNDFKLNPQDWADDASGYFQIDSNPDGWHYYFDSTSAAHTPRNDATHKDLRFMDTACVFRLWNFGDDYAPQCTTYTAFGINVGMNCNFSRDETPSHIYPSWDRIYMQDYYLPNNPLPYTYLDGDSCVQGTIDTTDAALHRQLFYNQIPTCFFPSLFHKDNCHAFKCESQTSTPICHLQPNALGLQKEGAFCFGTNTTNPPYGVEFHLNQTTPTGSRPQVEFNFDTAQNPMAWVPQYPGGQTGSWQQPQPILPYAMAGPYPNIIVKYYPNIGSIADVKTGYVDIGLIIHNGVAPDSLCSDTVYYHKFLKFPIIDRPTEILSPPVTIGAVPYYKLCVGDSLIIRPNVTHYNRGPNNDQTIWGNRTLATDVDEIEYRMSRIAPDESVGPRWKDYSYSIYENYLWFQNVPGETYLSNKLIRTINRINGNKRDTLFREEMEIGRVYKYTMRANVTQVRGILDVLFGSIGFDMALMNDVEIAEVLAAGCIDTTGLGQFIIFDYERDSFESFHYRDSSILPLDTTHFNDSNAYTLPAEVNGIFDLNFVVRSRLGGCLAINTHRVLVGFYNDMEVSDSVLCKDNGFTVTPYFRYFNEDPNRPGLPPPPWLELLGSSIGGGKFWTANEPQAGTPGFEGFTSWDWSMEDDDPNDPNTIFGNHPYGWIGYTNVEGGGPAAGRVYYNDSGFFTLRLAGEDRDGCRDTLYQSIFSTRLFADFSIDNELSACVNIVDIFDSSWIADPCIAKYGEKCDSIILWTFEWDDGKRNDVFDRNTYPPYKGNKISHNYTRNGTFKVKLTVLSELGCTDTMEITLTIGGPLPEFVIVGDTSICAGDSILFKNISGGQTQSAQYLWIFGDGSASSEDFITKNDSFWHMYSKEGTYDIYLSMYDSVKGDWCGFTYPDTTGGSQSKISVTVHGKDSVELTANKYIICPGEFIEFEVKGVDSGFVNYVGFNWNFRGGVVPPDPAYLETTTSTKVTKQFTEIGGYRIIVEGIHDTAFKDRCPHSDTIFIVVQEVVANFEIDSSKAPEFCFDNTSTGSIKHSWGFYHEEDITETGTEFKKDIETDDSPICRNYAEFIGQFYVCLIAENDIGCIDTICKTVSNFRSIQVPNVFTPRSGGGGDGLNDMFKIPIMGHDLFEVSIRNRWGDIVFKSDNSDVHWNGQVNNTGVECPDGTYFYMLKYRFKGIDEIIETNGIVQLIWEK